MQFQRYEKYKPSGIDWLGEIPEGWDFSLIKRIVKIPVTDGPHETPELFDEGIPFISAEAIKNDKIDFSKKRGYISKEDYIKFSKKYIPKINDIYLIKSGATTGNVAMVETNEVFTIWSPLAVIRPNHLFEPKYLFWFMLSKSFFKSIELNWSWGTQQNIGMGIIQNLPVLIPDKQTQTTIADYLDKHTALIDKKIELLRAKKQSYTQLKQTLINEVVTKGLDRAVEMKDSGIEWVGQIPKHWEVKRLKDLINIFTGNSIAEKDLFLNKKNSYPYIATKDIDIETNQIDYNNGIYIPKSDKNFKIAKKDSVLLCIEGANAGKKIAQTEMDICFVNKQCAMKSLNNKVVERYLFYFIQGGIFKSQFFLVLNGLIGGVSINLIKRIFLVIPQKSEQIAIANYLDEKTNKIDQIIKKIDENILTLQEFRKTLINDVVTGKVKVL